MPSLEQKGKLQEECLQKRDKELESSRVQPDVLVGPHPTWPEQKWATASMQILNWTELWARQCIKFGAQVCC